MKGILLLLVSFSVSSCAVYRVEKEGPIETVSASERITVESENLFGKKGGDCYNGVASYMTMGIVPYHCVDKYSVWADSREIGRAKAFVTQGWLPLLLIPFPKWNYGFGLNAERDIRNLVKVEE